MKTAELRKWINTLFLGVCAISLVIIIILISNLLVLQRSNSDSQTNTINNLSPSVVDTTTIKTPYGKVNFPAEFYSYLDYKENKSDNLAECVFSCKINDEIIELYKIVFGDETDDSPVGYLETKKARIPVSIVNNEIQIDRFNEEEINILQSMSETYSNVLVSISEWDEFVYE